MAEGLYQLKQRRRGIPLRDKIEAIAKSMDGQSSAAAIEFAYSKHGVTKFPAKPSITLAAWRQTVNRLLAENDEEAIRLCTEAEIICEQSSSPEKKVRNRKSKVKID